MKLSTLKEASGLFDHPHVLPLLRLIRPASQGRVAAVSPLPPGGDLFDRLGRHGPLAGRERLEDWGGVDHLAAEAVLDGLLQPPDSAGLGATL